MNLGRLVPLLLLLPTAVADDEMAAYVASRRAAMDDPSRPVEERERVALDVASTLDRAALATTNPEALRALWTEAAGLLDGFTARNPGHPGRRKFGLQSAVYSWAKGRGRALRHAAEPTDALALAEAKADFAAAVQRLEALFAESPGPADPLGENLRFRLARALADLADLDPTAPGAGDDRRRAGEVLGDKPFAEANLRGFAELLRAELLASLGRFDEAQVAYDASAGAGPSPSERLAVLVPIAAGRGKAADAMEAIAKSPLEDAERQMLAVRLRLAERSRLGPGPDRSRVEADAFRRAGLLRKAGKAEAKAVLIALARAVDEPSSGIDAEAWDLLAEGAQRLGQPDRSARLLVIAAAKVEARGDARSAASLRFRAAATLYQAGRFARAEGLFGRVAGDLAADKSLRARAGMLRAICLGRALEAGEPGATAGSYEAALAEQVKQHPDDPSTGEARWLLGRVRLDGGRRAEAESLWESVPKAHARWIDARLALRALARDDLEARRLVDDAATLRPAVAQARDAALALRSQARDDSERAEVDLELIRLDLLPVAGDPRRALEEIDHLLLAPLRDDQRDRAKRLRIAALAMAERYVEAETAARQVDREARPGPLLALARVLDRAASAADTDRVARRLGGVERMVADAVGGRLSPAEAAEARLRKARGRLLAGDTAGARAILQAWPDAVAAVAPLGPDALADLGEAEAQAGDLARAMDAFRRVIRTEAGGSPRWFRARLGEVEALARSGQKDAARQVFEGTALLHPGLGGPIMRPKFEAARRRP